ncbi:MAG: glycosyltransferase family 2 protein [Methylococcaceae bacterium]|nr:glycosyltransferase family 2 protein [Methylococcaceae bacterium]
MQCIESSKGQNEAVESDLAIVILTFNEDKHIERCLYSAFQVAQKVFVVDSYSMDQTVAIAKSLGAQIWQHEFKNHAAQLAWALENLPINTEWVMRVDADEIITPNLAKSIRLKIASAAPVTNGFIVSRYPRFAGAFIRHGGFPQWQLRIWRKGTAEIEQRWMDEHMVLKTGQADRLTGEYIDDNLNNITWWTNKHNGYATREAIDLLNQKYDFLPVTTETGELTRQARYKRWLKEHLYTHLPLGLRAFLFFFYRMIFQLGFLDGRAGFVFHFLQGFWYRFLVDVKVSEVERRMRADGIDCVEAIKREFGVNPVYETSK